MQKNNLVVYALLINKEVNHRYYKQEHNLELIMKFVAIFTSKIKIENSDTNKQLYIPRTSLFFR